MNCRNITAFLTAIFLGLPILAGQSVAQEERIIATRGDWEVIKMPPSASHPGGECLIRSSSAVKGGRRPHAEIRIKLSPLSIFLAPDRDLSGVMMALAVIEDRATRRLPKRTLEHQLRVDGGAIVSHNEGPPLSGRWDATRNMTDAGKFFDALSTGSTLIYQWKLDRAGKTHIFKLDGMAAMVKTVKNSSPCSGT